MLVQRSTWAIYSDGGGILSFCARHHRERVGYGAGCAMAGNTTIRGRMWAGLAPWARYASLAFVAAAFTVSTAGQLLPALDDIVDDAIDEQVEEQIAEQLEDVVEAAVEDQVQGTVDAAVEE